jgi:hypothetical protein
MNFEGCLPNWKSDAEKYLRACYIADWSPEATVARDERVARLNDVTNKQNSKKRADQATSLLKPKRKKLKSGNALLVIMIDMQF